MKRFLLTPVLAIAVLAVGACSHLTPKQKKTAAAVGGVALDFAQKITDIAVQVIVAKATSNADLSKKGDLLDSAALGLRTLEKRTDGILTPAVVAATVTQFTDPAKAHWSDLATQLGNQVISSPLPTDSALESAANGLNAAALESRQDAAAPTNP